MKKIALFITTVLVILLSGCATTVSPIYGFTEDEEVTLPSSEEVMYKNDYRLKAGNYVYTYGDMCQLKKGGIVRISSFGTNRSGSQYFSVYYKDTEEGSSGSKHEKNYCPSGTGFTMSEDQFVRLTGRTKELLANK